jgi:hypothetical protein
MPASARVDHTIRRLQEQEALQLDMPAPATAGRDLSGDHPLFHPTQAARRVIYGHALRNALIPVVTAFGLQLGWLLGGAVVVEQVFAWPGLGRLMIEAIGLRDVTIVQAGVFWFALSFLFINLLVDMSYTLLDPRIRYD